MTKMQSNPGSPGEPIPDSDLVPADDTIIGRAFRWSLAALLVIAGGVGVAIWVAKRERPVAETVIDKDTGPITGLERPATSLPAVRFTDVTASAGIDFVHFSGARGEKLLPETMGAGCAVFDCDGDGDQDLLFVNGTHWPWDAAPPQTPALALYRNDGRGKFEDITAPSGLAAESFYGTGAACGDYDNDGRVDLFIAAVGRDRLYRNVGGGRFEDVTTSAGVAGPQEQWSTSAGFFDADNDGDLDLFVCCYVEWSRDIDIELNYTLNGVDRAYGPPTNFKGAPSCLFRNEGNGTFTDVSESAGIHVLNPATGLPVGKSLGLCFVDVDDDGLLDVVVANDTTQNFLFRNEGECRFAEIGVTAGVAYDGMGRSTGAMGIDAAHFRNDQDLAVAIGNFANEMTSFYVRQAGSLQFSDDAIVEGVGGPSRLFLKFGVFFFDGDLDGRLDLLEANGHLEEEINQVQASQHYRQSAQLFWNAGRDASATYAELPRDLVGDLSHPLVARGAAYGDIDGDGDLDVVITQVSERPVLLRNDQALGHHWLRVALRGRRSNRDGIGARVELQCNGEVQQRLVSPTRSYLSQVELPVTFGLGSARAVDKLTVVWPDGTKQAVPVEGIDRTLVVEQAAESVAAR